MLTGPRRGAKASRGRHRSSGQRWSTMGRPWRGEAVPFSDDVGEAEASEGDWACGARQEQDADPSGNRSAAAGGA